MCGKRLKRLYPALALLSAGGLLLPLPALSAENLTISEAELQQIETTLDAQQKLLEEWARKSQGWQTELENLNEIIRQQNSSLAKSEKEKQRIQASRNNWRLYALTLTAGVMAGGIVLKSVR